MGWQRGMLGRVLAVVTVLAVGGCADSVLPVADGPTGQITPVPGAGGSVAGAPPVAQQLILSFTGDNILGTDANFDPATGLLGVWEANDEDPGYFYQNVRDIFLADDLTVADFEVALTRSQEKRYKGEGEVYHFAGPARIAKTLPVGGIDTVTLANNHTFDFGQRGFDDTRAALDDAGVSYFGLGDEGEGSDYDIAQVIDVRGVKIGLVGYQAWADTPEMRRKIAADFASLRERGAAVVIPFFHWGIESEHLPYEVQTGLGAYAVDEGADLVVATHPHVIQSLDVYDDTLIAYSFGNFAFGGNTNPTDKRAFILQARLNMLGDELQSVDYRVIPVRISRTEAYNDYVPTPYDGAERGQVLGFINSISPDLPRPASTRFQPVVPG